MKFRMHIQLALALVSILACLIFYYTIYYLKYSASLNYLNWDCRTITAADFTVKITIPRSVYLKWQTSEKVRETNETFETYLKREIVKQVNSLPKVLKGEEYKKCYIANISIAFANTKVQELLKKRGKNLINGKYK